MKPTLFAAVMLVSIAGLSNPGYAAPVDVLSVPVDVLSVSVQTSTPLQPAVARSNVFIDRAPINLLAPTVSCDATDSPKACALRQAAARRAVEVTAAEVDARHDVKPLGLLIPVGLVPVRDVTCDPAMSIEECNRLNHRPPATQPFATPGPVPPLAPVPAPAPDQGKIPPLTAVPQAAQPPIAADPQSIVPPPPTGDGDIVKKPPATDPEMPVIKPKANPPVIQ